MAKYAQLVATGLPHGVLLTIKDTSGHQVSELYPEPNANRPDSRARYADGDGALSPATYVPNGTYTVAYSGGSQTVVVTGAAGLPAASVYVDQATQAELDAVVTAGSGTSGQGLPSTVQNKTSAYTASAGDLVLANAASAGFTVTLPAAPATGALVTVKKIDATTNIVTVVASGGGTTDGDASTTITSPQFGATFEHVGSNAWRIVGVTASGGSNGTNGKTVLYGTGAPSAGTGTDGDTYIDSAASMIYGPKASGAWPSGVSLVGAGVPSGGTTGQVLKKNSSTNYDTSWTSASGTPGPAVTQGLIAWTFDPVAGTSNFTPTSGSVYFFKAMAAQSGTVSTVYFPVGATGSGLTYARIGIYDTSGVQLAISADAMTAMTGGTGNRSVALGSSISVAAGDILVLGVLVVGTSMPILRGIGLGYGFRMGPTVTNSVPSRYHVSAGQSALPTPATWTSYTAPDTGTIMTLGIG